MKKLRICYLADWKSIHTQRWLRYFVNRCHEVHLISDAPIISDVFRKCKELKGIKLHNFLVVPCEWRMKKLNSKFYATLNNVRLKYLLKKIKPDILHAHFAYYYGWLGAKSEFHPYVLTVWGSDIYRSPYSSSLIREQIIYTLKKVDLITSDSENLRKATIELGASSNENYVIQWGVDLTRFNSKVDSTEIRKRLDIDRNPIVLSTRSFKTIYNIDILIRAIPFVLKEIPNTKFILKNSYGDEKNQMKRLVRELGLNGAVRFADTVDYEEMVKYYAASDIFVSIPSSDSTSISLLEAMACGVAPIVSDLPSVKEWIKDGENGYIVPLRDPKALAEAIIRLLKDEKTRRLFAKRNITLVREKADHHRYMQKMEELYYSLTKNNKGYKK